MTDVRERNRLARRRLRHITVVAVLLGSAVAHAVVVATVHLPVAAVIIEEPVEPQSPLSFTCEADAALATAAQLSMCATPFSDSASSCAAKAMVEHDLAVTRCSAVEFAMLDDPEVLEKLAAPKPLVEDVLPVDDIVAAELIEKEVAEKLEEAQKQISSPKLSGQVVEITQPNVEMRPDKAKYLSEYDSAVKKETVARGSTEEMVEKPGPRQLPSSQNPTPLPNEITQPPPADPTKAPNAIDRPESDGDTSQQAPSVMAMRGPDVGEEVSPRSKIEAGVADGEEATSPDGVAVKKGNGLKQISSREGRLGSEKATEGGSPTEGGTGSGEEVRPVPNLRPTEKMLSRAVGGGSVDKVDGVEQGDNTALNSRKWKYASFFNRMKRRVAQNWHPDKVYLRRDPTGKIYGTKDRLTVLRVSLTRKGKLAKVFVAQQSGVDFLDEEAIRAFREAQPFPNPPNALVDSKSNLITFSFGFHFQIGDRTNWKIFRYR